MLVVEGGDECFCFLWQLRETWRVVVKCTESDYERLGLREDVRSDAADGGGVRRGWNGVDRRCNKRQG